MPICTSLGDEHELAATLAHSAVFSWLDTVSLPTGPSGCPSAAQTGFLPMDRIFGGADASIWTAQASSNRRLCSWNVVGR